MPRGTSWAVYAILQFINRIIVTLHFFCRSKLFYFSEFLNFDSRLWIRGVDIVGVGIIKNYPSPTGGPGGRPSPPGSGRRIPGCVRPGFEETVPFTIYYRPWRSWSDTPLRFWFFAKKLNFTQKWPKTQKNTKIVRMTSYSQVKLAQNLAPQKYKFLIFRTIEGDFGGTLVKNQ
jgi:hypothetical protein